MRIDADNWANHYYSGSLMSPSSSEDRWISHEPVATQSHSSDGHSVISHEPVTTKNHSSQVV
jgi:hypothetical protein